MRQKIDYCIITFATTAQAMAVEAFCQREHLPGRMIPVPQSVSAGCGLAWRMLPQERQQVEVALAAAEIEWESMKIAPLWERGAV